jgi:hypothetical protein
VREPTGRSALAVLSAKRSPLGTDFEASAEDRDKGHRVALSLV